MNCAVIVFPGSNCDHDCFHILNHVLGVETDWIWHKEQIELSMYDFIVLPGGFSYGDYLRAGAIAKFSPIMKSVIRFAGEGGHVLGICNGFQILVESGLLPGALLHNHSHKFICKFVHVKVENAETPFTRLCEHGSILKIPIAHHQGNYFTNSEALKRMEENDQIVLRYCGELGDISDEANPNGSMGNIAAVCNEQKNVLGMMPHPERAADPLFRELDGQLIFKSILQNV